MSILPDTIVKFNELESRLGEMASVMVGEIRFLSYRATALPAGWYFCNGDKYATTSVQGVVLTGLTATFKSDWGITTASSKINVPNFFASDGLGYFVRAADGSTRQVGSAAAQGDAMREMIGKATFSIINVNSVYANADTTITDNVFFSSDYVAMNHIAPAAAQTGGNRTLNFAASRAAPTADEIRPKNIGMTPAIYLGV